MKFEEVLPFLREGKKIRRKYWKPYEYIELKEKILNEKGEYYIIFLNDILCDNWELYQEEPLLTKDEKEFIKGILNFLKDDEINVIYFFYQEVIQAYVLYFETEYYETKYKFTFSGNKQKYFKKLEDDKSYTLKELGLDE